MSEKRAAPDHDISPPPAKRKIAATTTSKAVANFFKPASQKEPEKVTFQLVQKTLLVGRYRATSDETRTETRPFKVAAFDFDDTLIKTKSGNVFARGAEDWQWWHATVPTRLKKLYADGYTIVVVSNQGGINPTPDKGIDRKQFSNFKDKVSACLNALDLPITLYAATDKDLFRKPRTGMWDQIKHDHSVADSEVDRANSFFVGDAAGREGNKAANVRADHSCSDRNFATNVGISFYTPEEFFLGEDKRSFTRSFDPNDYTKASSEALSSVDSTQYTKNNAVDIVLFCGSPGAGKSTYYWKYMQPLGYERANQDILKTRDKCMKFATEQIKDQKSVVVDNTNADVDTRAAWVTLAQSLDVPIRLVYFTASAKLCEHNDTVRALSNHRSLNWENRTMLPKAAFASFTSRYREPKVTEGFQDITRVEFVFQGTEEEKELWNRHWIS